MNMICKFFQVFFSARNIWPPGPRAEIREGIASESLQKIRRKFYEVAGVEFALQSQHETFPDFGIQPRNDFNDWEKESTRRTWSLVSFIVDKCELEEHRGN